MVRSTEQYEANNHPSESYSRKDEETIEELERKFGSTSREVAEYIHTIAKEEAREKMGVRSPIEQKGEKGRLLNLIDNILDLVNSIKLAKPNKKDEQILKKEKEKAKELIEDVLRSAAAYTEAVNSLRYEVSFKSEEGETKHYQSRVEGSDKRRKAAHNAMMSNINIALRYINEHFASYSEDALEDVEENFAARNEPFIQAQRVRFPSHLFLPETISLKNRDDLGKWGVLVAEELANYRAGLSKF